MREGEEYELTIELVPRTCWHKNVRYLRPREWDGISHYFRERAEGHCQICGAACEHLHAHEIWEYDEQAQKATLTGIIAICPLCHSVKHMGHTQKTGHVQAAKLHFMQVNCVVAMEFSLAMMEAKAAFDRRSQMEWRVDISWLDSQPIISPAAKDPLPPRESGPILRFLSDYILIDVETTGLDPWYDRIIEVAALNVRNNEITDRFCTLVSPLCPIPPFITELTGITNEMLTDAPDAATVFPALKRFLGNLPLVGCRTSFDVNFVGQALLEHCGSGLLVPYVDVQGLARRLCYGLPDYTLPTLAKHFTVTYRAHRAESDCLCTKKVYDRLRTLTLERYGSVAIFEQIANSKSKSAATQLVRAALGPVEGSAFWADKRFFFNGQLEFADKKHIMQLIIEKGGDIVDRDAKRATIIVRSRHAKAPINTGIPVITEMALYDMLEREGSYRPWMELEGVFDIQSFEKIEHYEQVLAQHAYQFQYPLQEYRAGWSFYAMHPIWQKNHRQELRRYMQENQCGHMTALYMYRKLANQ